MICKANNASASRAWVTRGILALFLLMATVAQAGDTARVRFIYPTRFTTDQMGTAWLVWVEPHAEHRQLTLAAFDGDVEVTSSVREMAGERSAKVWRFDWRTPLPAGELLIVAAVFNSTREVARATVPVTVQSMRP